MAAGMVATLRDRILTSQQSLPNYYCGTSVRAGHMRFGRLWAGQEKLTDPRPEGMTWRTPPIGKQCTYGNQVILTVYDDGTAMFIPSALWHLRYHHTRYAFKYEVYKFYDILDNVNGIQHLLRKPVSGTARIGRTNNFLNYIEKKKGVFV